MTAGAQVGGVWRQQQPMGGLCVAVKHSWSMSEGRTAQKVSLVAVQEQRSSAGRGGLIDPRFAPWNRWGSTPGVLDSPAAAPVHDHPAVPRSQPSGELFFILFLTFSLSSIAPFTPRRCRALRLPARWRRDNAGVKTNSEDFPLWSGVWVFFWCRWIHTQQTSAVTADRAGALGFCNWIIVAVTEEQLLHKRLKGLKITSPSCWWWCGGTGRFLHNKQCLCAEICNPTAVVQLLRTGF